MTFGLITQIQTPRPWSADAEIHAYHNAIAQAAVADAAGFDHSGIAEQHVFTEIGHSASPDMLPSAICQRTSRIQPGLPPSWGKAPNMFGGSADVLRAGMVVSVEPAVFLPEEGLGVRLIDNVLVTDSGVEVLSTTPRDLVLVG